MYNGVGLPTARGSGTSGRVQSNNFILRPRPSPSSSRDPAAPVVARGGGGIREEMAEHERKRAMESRLLELREALEEQGYAEAEVETRLAAEARKQAAESAAAAKEAPGHGGGGVWPKGTPL
ncbi:pre-mRNA-splicing factor CWC21 [Brachypodium distachyon]|uniref:pre-mRNA-splicing factor CWC21 n=1 Tax=Brachypodium distachyon TaxID=15368 RepID=UPI0001C73649|nr:pre-mRNA-splicing factor CWC21 [Brachypodium distachyon]|eukprot:XP_003571540.1 pre-mRNA-splicing factor CWC21 [Brachypodium distachyon]